MTGRYRVVHAYRAERDGETLGPWEPGQEIDLTPGDAEWVVRDSPGALEPLDQADPTDEAAADGKSRRQGRAAADRQHKGGGTR